MAANTDSGAHFMRSVSEGTTASTLTNGSQFTSPPSLGVSTGPTSPSFSNPDGLSEFVDRDVIPPKPLDGPRTLVLCFDGTGDQFDSDNSNVVLLFSMLMKDSPSEQMVYYQAGIGTYTIPQIATPMWSNFSKTLDEMIAWNLDAHVMAGYEFLMTNYQSGDKICLFGFSRGAYTARALAGMVHKVGLLPRCNHQQVPFAYKMFTRTDEVGWKQSTAFKKAFTMDVDIEFIGVWDTVCSVGLIPRTLPFTSSNTAIRTFRHALSLDEHRAKFKANHYNYPTEEEGKLGTQPGDMPKSGAKKRWATKKTKTDYEAQFAAQEFHNHKTDVLEVWFAGCHCDVGGGSVPNDDTRNLARIPLRWMIRQCFLTKTGIRFHADGLRSVGLDPEALFPVVKPRPAALYSLPSADADHVRDTTGATLVDTSIPQSEEEEDYRDALCPIYDQLKLAPYWWVLEVVPLAHRVQNALHQWFDKLYVNMGRGRIVPTHEPFNVHRSVDIRLKAGALAAGGPYKPNAVYPSSMQINWVD